MREYLFDVTLLAAIRVRAETEKEARNTLAHLLDCATVNAGHINGEPVVFEASMEGEADLEEIDGVAV